MNSEFPYRTLMAHPAWPIIESALDELEGNGDLEFKTSRRYVIGYLIQQLVAEGLISPAIAVYVPLT